MKALVTLALVLMLMLTSSVGRTDEPISICKFVAPKYSAIARRAWLSGEVILKVGVAADGTVNKVDTISGNPILARSATDAVKGWRYCASSASANYEVAVTFRFKLQGPGTDNWAPTDVVLESPASVEVTTNPPAPLEGDFIKKK